MSSHDVPLVNRSAPLSRRQLLQATVLGGGAAAFRGQTPLRAMPRHQGAPSTLTLVTPCTLSDLDPHSVYDAGSGVLMNAAFEGLLRLRPGSPDDYERVLAESWESDETGSLWTFQLRKGVQFQDGTSLWWTAATT